MELQQIVERVADIRHARPSTAVRQRVQEAAQELDRAGQMQLRVELVNEALMALTTLLFNADSDRQPANIDRVTWRLLVPAPWGGSGWRKWGLRYYEGEVLRNIMHTRSANTKHRALYDYNETSRTWHLALDNYPGVDAAMAYLQKAPVTLNEWRKHSESYRARMLKAQNKRRGVS